MCVCLCLCVYVYFRDNEHGVKHIRKDSFRHLNFPKYFRALAAPSRNEIQCCDSWCLLTVSFCYFMVLLINLLFCISDSTGLCETEKNKKVIFKEKCKVMSMNYQKWDLPYSFYIFKQTKSFFHRYNHYLELSLNYTLQNQC